MAKDLHTERDEKGRCLTCLWRYEKLALIEQVENTTDPEARAALLERIRSL